MAEITLQLSDDLAKRLAPFHDRLPELLERGLRSMVDEHTEGDRTQASVLSHHHLKALGTLRQLRSDIQARHGVYDGDLVAEARSDGEDNLNQYLESAS